MIEIKNVSMIFEKKENKKAQDNGRLKALDQVSLTIPEGCVYGFLGSNGAGKSTLMRMMCGVYKIDEGSITIDGEDVFNQASAKEKIFFINDETIQYSDFTLDDLSKYYASYYVKFSFETYHRLVNRLELPTNKRMSEFSKGMKRQAIVIIGLSCMTKYLLLDEAFDGLDPAMRKIVKDIIIDEMLDRQATVIVSSHNIAEINELCDKAMLIHQGKLIFADEIDDIKAGFRKVQIARKDACVSIEELQRVGVDIVKYTSLGSVVQVIIKGDENTILQKLSEIKTDFTEIVPMTLEEIFIYELEARGYGTDIITNTEG